VNTNFGWANHYLPKMMEISAEESANDEHVTRIMHRRRALYERFREMVPMLATAFPEKTILVRPHPVESHQPWQEIARRHTNIIVAAEGNVVPWLMACKALVHNGCTTAVEAAVLGTPTIAYQPIPAHQDDNDLANSLSHDARDDASLRALLKEILEGSIGALDTAESRRLMDLHIGAREGALAVDRMVDVLDEMGFRERLPPSPGMHKRLEGWVRAKIRTAGKKRNAESEGHRNSTSYHDHRFPEVPVEEMRGRVARFAAELGRFRDIRVTVVSDHVFLIEGPEQRD
jgi:hypothetical protein